MLWGVTLSARAFILVNCSSGKEADVLALVKTLGDTIVESYAVYGLHDLIIHLQAESLEYLQDQIVQEIRKLPNVRQTMTLPVVRE